MLRLGRLQPCGKEWADGGYHAEGQDIRYGHKTQDGDRWERSVENVQVMIPSTVCHLLSVGDVFMAVTACWLP
ncbi:hypothetical protein ACOMHN_058282 [Nucella lapillus]